eukprot:scaffold1928_cov381-Prasinococcus_capsulatus_cf.AAC.20
MRRCLPRVGTLALFLLLLADEGFEANGDVYGHTYVASQTGEESLAAMTPTAATNPALVERIGRRSLLSRRSRKTWIPNVRFVEQSREGNWLFRGVGLVGGAFVWCHNTRQSRQLEPDGAIG